jgi:hypothetical protein
MNFPGGHRAIDSTAMSALPRIAESIWISRYGRKLPEADIGRVRYAMFRQQ